MKNYRKYKEMKQTESTETHNSDKECIYDKDHFKSAGKLLFDLSGFGDN